MTKDMFDVLSKVMAIGEVMNEDKKGKNDWDKRMLEAGLGNSGLQFPDDWDTLSEEEKEKRLRRWTRCLVQGCDGNCQEEGEQSPSSISKKVYHVLGGGDRDVGLGDVEAKITIEDNCEDEDDEIQVENWKEFLSDYYDIGVKNVFTEKEWIEEEIVQEEYDRKERRVRKPSPHKGKGVLLPSRAKIVKASL